MHRTLGIVVIASALLVFAACGSDDEDDSGGAGTTTVAAWNGPPRAAEDGTVDVDSFNAYVDSVGGDLAESPREQAEVFPGTEREASEKVVDVDENGDSAEGTVTLEGLADDSIHSQRWQLAFERSGDSWTLTSARFSQRCHPGRGHEDFTPELCL